MGWLAMVGGLLQVTQIQVQKHKWIEEPSKYKKHMLISLGCASMFEVYTFDKANKNYGPSTSGTSK